MRRDYMDNYKPFNEIELGFSDAENYLNDHKEMFKTIFINRELNSLMKRSITYLIGEKGTGKTAYAVYFENNDYKNTKSERINMDNIISHSFISSTEKNFNFKNCKEDWTVLLLLKMAKSITPEDLENTDSNNNQHFLNLREKIKDIDLSSIYNNIEITIKTTDSNNIALGGKIDTHIIKVSGEANSQVLKSVEIDQLFITNIVSLHNLKNDFIDAFKKIRLKRNRFIFIDKVDDFKKDIAFSNFLLLIKGLGEAAHDLNTEVFGKIKGNYYTKFILLLRPEIFGKLDMYNQGSKATNNSVILDWLTSYNDYRNSDLFELADNILRYANKELDDENKKEKGFYWDLYFKWDAPSTNPVTRERDDAFISFLRSSLCRPRDIVNFLLSIQKQAIHVKSKQIDTTFECFNSFHCQKDISDYFLAEAKDWCRYKYPETTFETIKKFFSFINTGKAIDYNTYCKCFENFKMSCEINGDKIFEEMQNPQKFLQLLYDLNMICYIQSDHMGGTFQTYCYRLRSLTELSPVIPINKEYRIHRALLKSLNIEER